MKLTEDEKKFLLETARRSIAHLLENGRPLELKPADVRYKRLVEDGAAFVTLHLRGKLRGCIGSLEASRPLVFDVIDNAGSAAFRDPRFYPLTKEELKEAVISISVLTHPVKMGVKTPEELLEGLEPKRHGLIIKRGYARATFLPVVWEQLPEKEDFLGQLCMKAGLAPTAWKDTSEMEFYTYEAIEFSE